MWLTQNDAWNPLTLPSVARRHTQAAHTIVVATVTWTTKKARGKFFPTHERLAYLPEKSNPSRLASLTCLKVRSFSEVFLRARGKRSPHLRSCSRSQASSYTREQWNWYHSQFHFFFLKSRHLEQSRGSLRLSFHSYEPIYNHS